MRPSIGTIGMTMGALVLLCAGLAAQKRTVWDGVYTADQAKRGAAAYQQSCAGCHGPDLSGNGTAPSLSAESFFFQWSDTTVADLFKRIKTAMPPDRPDSLPADTYRDIVAFVLEFNKVPAGQVALDTDPQNLEQIAITAPR